MKILFVEWFTTAIRHFGVVVGEDEFTKQKKAYIGECQPGGSPVSDSEYIAQHGAKIFPVQLRSILEALEDMDPKLTASEALFGFVGYITTREEKICAGSHEECGQWVELIDKFCRANKLPHPREGWEKNLATHPKESDG